MTTRERAAMDGHPAAAAPGPQPPAPEAAVPQHLTLHEAAERLGVSYRTLWRQVRAGTLPAMRIGRAIRVSVEDLEQLRHDPDAAARAGRSAARTTPPPRARQPRGEFARMARGLPSRESATPGGGR
ncbi:helix-turn-helix domain-containing protein [Miltoncostaea marina]|uniref:helix-turn-helix domain-containing protein n=1 Tax=Miltoncostaea marina TaxID=2843215 RepID=UPI001C3D0EBB|nr:helix-turn-helix domain-containing protein [Miltoncostaea marina]